MHYPTDINLLFDAMRKAIEVTASYAVANKLPNWRQYQFNVRTVKRAMRKIQKMNRSTSKQIEKKLKREKEIYQCYKDYVKLSQKYIKKVQQTLEQPVGSGASNLAQSTIICEYIDYATHQIDLIQRRNFNGEKIPHKDKIHSIFQSHTEWINKGKAGIPVELGLRVCIVEHPSGYILHHKVMQNETDSNIVVAIIKETQKLFPWFKGCSFDKGFHSPDNQIELANILDDLILPKKGKCNKVEAQREGHEEFRIARRKHSAVESGINALENHGLDICLDHGIVGFKRYVAMAVVARNIQKLGSVLIAKDLAKIKREKRKLKLVV